MPYRVEWLGDEIAAWMLVKAEEAVTEVVEAAAEEARRNHWWSNRTGDLESNVIAEPAKPKGLLVEGKFGSSLRREGFYGLFLERKTPWLRPAADRTFPLLRAAIKRRI